MLVEPLGHDDVGAREDRIELVGGVAEVQVDVHVGPDLRVKEHLALECGERVEDRRLLLDVGPYALGGGLGEVRIGRDDDGDRLADEADTVAGDHRLQAPVGYRRLLAGLEPQRDPRRGEFGRVTGRERRDDARHLPDLVELDPEDRAVRDGAADDPRPHLVGPRDVGDVLAGPGDQPSILEPADVSAGRAPDRQGTGAHRPPISCWAAAAARRIGL